MEASGTSEDKRQKAIGLENEYECRFSNASSPVPSPSGERAKGEGKPMKQTITTFALSAMLLALCLTAHAQQPKKIPRIGFLAGVSPSTISARTEAFRRGLRELEYVEGKNIVIEWRYADEKLDRLNDLAAELVRLKVEVIVSAAPTVTRSVKESTKTIPLVMAFDDDPVGNGFVASLARPGGNITGLSNLSLR
jgi:putative tryptophan/tyrosine transport system substrate-binding protein